MAQQRKLKIAQVIDDTLDSTDGVQQVVLAVGQWLTQQGHEVHYITSTTERTSPENIHSIAGNIRLKFNGNRLGIPLPARYTVLKELLQQEKFDVVHIHMPYSPFLAGRLIRVLPEHTALVGTFHILPLSRASRLGGKALGLIQRRQATRFDEILSASAPACDFARYMYGRSSIAIGNPVDVGHFSAARDRARASTRDDAAAAKILFVGRLVERKGAGALINAVTRVRELTQHPFTVEIAGRGPLMEHYTNVVRERGLDGVVSLTGFVEENAKADLLASADIVALPALGGESFGISVVEALTASPGAVLAGNNDGYSSVIGPLTECLIDPRDTEGFAQRLVELIENPESRAVMSEKQAARAREFDSDVVGKKVLAAYQRAIALRQQ